MGEFRETGSHSFLPRVGKKGRRQVLVDKTGKGSWKNLVDKTENDGFIL